MGVGETGVGETGVGKTGIPRFYIILYHFMLHYTKIKKIPHEHLSGFTGLCIPHWILLSI